MAEDQLQASVQAIYYCGHGSQISAEIGSAGRAWVRIVTPHGDMILHLDDATAWDLSVAAGQAHRMMLDHRSEQLAAASADAVAEIEEVYCERD